MVRFDHLQSWTVCLSKKKFRPARTNKFFGSGRPDTGAMRLASSLLKEVNSLCFRQRSLFSRACHLSLLAQHRDRLQLAWIPQTRNAASSRDYSIYTRTGDKGTVSLCVHCIHTKRQPCIAPRNGAEMDWSKNSKKTSWRSYTTSPSFPSVGS
jgi:hypothetical protein